MLRLMSLLSCIQIDPPLIHNLGIVKVKLGSNDMPIHKKATIVVKWHPPLSWTKTQLNNQGMAMKNKNIPK